MGYDMRIKGGITAEEKAAQEAIDLKIDAALTERAKHERNTAEHIAAQEEVSRLYNEKWELPSDYFRLNNMGMGWCRELMEERGMVYDTHTPEFPDAVETLGKYPKPEDFETPEKYEAAAYEWDEKYEELSKPILEIHPEGGDTIPSHKLCSNDGWHVTEAECAAAAAAGKAAPTPVVHEDGKDVEVQWWPEWIDYLERASTRGGFTVR